jgi:hypothetical protein
MIRRGGGISHRGILQNLKSWEDGVSSRSPRRVMMTTSCLLGKLGQDSDTFAYGFYLELGQYS